MITATDHGSDADRRFDRSPVLKIGVDLDEEVSGKHRAQDVVGFSRMADSLKKPWKVHFKLLPLQVLNRNRFTMGLRIDSDPRLQLSCALSADRPRVTHRLPPQ